MVVHKRCVKQPMHVIANISLYKYAKKKKTFVIEWGMKITRQFKDGNLRRVFRKFVVGYCLISDLLQDVSLSSHSHDGSKI